MDRRTHPGVTRVIPGAVLLVAIATLATGCGISRTKYVAVETERDQLAIKSKQLQSGFDQCTEEKTTLESNAAALRQKTQVMEAELDAQKRAAESMRASYEGLLGNLKSEVESGKIEVEQMRDGLSLNMSQDILFRSGSAELDQTGRALLIKISDDLKTATYQIVVMGHTDNMPIRPSLAGRYPTNWELGGARAARIVRLFQQAGIAKERMIAVSLADSRPRERNESVDGRARNRRIEIRLRPMTAETATNSPN